MSIKTQEAAVSIDFTYEDEKNGQEYNVKFHPTKELGKTVSISSDELIAYEENSKTYVSLPASLLVEVVDFLRINNYLNNRTLVNSGGQSQRTNNVLGDSGYSASSLPVPDLYSEPRQSTTPVGSPRIDFEPLSQEQPVQTLSMRKEASETLEVPDLSGQDDDNEIEDDVEIEDIEDEDLAEIKKAAKERELAKGKPQSNTKKFKLKSPTREEAEEKIRKNSEIDYDNIPEA